jgi:hypothetical protein|tara:strand:+ start:378 stop:608 length:231 start_codon:yes stop_codon:yes gene_type:complete
MKTPIELLYEYADYLDNGGSREDSDGESVMSDGELLDLVIEATEQKPTADGLPTDRQILMAINNALYHHFNEESNL